MEVAYTLEKFLELFDAYCEDSQYVEDRRWNRRESERLRDFCIYMESIYITDAEK